MGQKAKYFQICDKAPGSAASWVIEVIGNSSEVMP